jgi:uncharacterized protein YndB with AHSA1/START domain
MNDFSTTFTVDRTPTEAFDAITDVRHWWSEDVVGDTRWPGGEFYYHFQDKHRCTIQITEAVPGRRVAWRIVENYFAFTEDQTEWAGTTVTFDIAERDGKTEVRFAHVGLLPEHECFDVCSNAWTFFVNTSLRTLIETGAGLPNANGRSRLRAEAA